MIGLEKAFSTNGMYSRLKYRTVTKGSYRPQKNITNWKQRGLQTGKKPVIIGYTVHFLKRKSFFSSTLFSRKQIDLLKINIKTPTQNPVHPFDKELNKLYIE